MCGAIGSKKKISKEQWGAFVEKFDENKDRMIDYFEFKKMMMSFHDHFQEHEAQKDTQSSSSLSCSGSYEP